jgi:hypothetical protein
MTTVLVIATIAFLGTFGYLIWETNNQDARTMCRRNHPSYKGW